MINSVMLNAILICNPALWFFANDLLLAFLKYLFYTMHVCSWYWSKKEFSSSPWHYLTTYRTPVLQKSRAGLQSSCLIHHSHPLTHQQNASSSNILITFCREKLSTISKTEKILSKSYWILKHWIFKKVFAAFIYLE